MMQVVRRTNHNDSSSMNGILAPDLKPVLHKNYHKDNLTQMKRLESKVQSKLEEQHHINQVDPWKMKRFKAVESKIVHFIGRKPSSHLILHRQ